MSQTDSPSRSFQLTLRNMFSKTLKKKETQSCCNIVAKIGENQSAEDTGKQFNLPLPVNFLNQVEGCIQINELTHEHGTTFKLKEPDISKDLENAELEETNANENTPQQVSSESNYTLENITLCSNELQIYKIKTELTPEENELISNWDVESEYQNAVPTDCIVEAKAVSMEYFENLSQNVEGNEESFSKNASEKCNEVYESETSNSNLKNNVLTAKSHSIKRKKKGIEMNIKKMKIVQCSNQSMLSYINTKEIENTTDHIVKYIQAEAVSMDYFENLRQNVESNETVCGVDEENCRKIIMEKCKGISESKMNNNLKNIELTAQLSDPRERKKEKVENIKKKKTKVYSKQNDKNSFSQHDLCSGQKSLTSYITKQKIKKEINDIINSDNQVLISNILTNIPKDFSSENEAGVTTAINRQCPSIKVKSDAFTSCVEDVPPKFLYCKHCKQFTDDPSLVVFPGDDEAAVDESVMLTNPQLSLFSDVSLVENIVDTPLHKITDFTVYDRNGHLCQFDNGLIEQDIELYFSGFVKPIYEEDCSPDGGICTKNLGPIDEWWIGDFDGGEEALIGFTTAFAEYVLMKPSDIYSPFMNIILEKIYISKIVIEFLMVNAESTYEDLVDRINAYKMIHGPFQLTEDSLLRHAQFIVNQVQSYDFYTKSVLLISSPCMKTFVELTGVVLGNRHILKKMHGIVVRRNRCGTCDACLTPNCGKCGFCQNMKKYGGSGTWKQACTQRRCQNKN